MSETDVDRIKGDLAVIRRAMALRLSFGREMVVFGILVAAGAGVAAVVSLWSDNDWGQLGLCAAVMMLCVIWLYRRSSRVESLGHEIKLQVVLSITVYAVLIVSAAGYSLAAAMSATIGAARTIGLYAAAVGYIMVFLPILVYNALKSRERYYCLGFAVALLLAGLLIQITNYRYSCFLAHCFMAVGALTGAIIQRAQLRTVKGDHAPN
jgi:hypothetical protein